MVIFEARAKPRRWKEQWKRTSLTLHNKRGTLRRMINFIWMKKHIPAYITVSCKHQVKISFEASIIKLANISFKIHKKSFEATHAVEAEKIQWANCVLCGSA